MNEYRTIEVDFSDGVDRRDVEPADVEDAINIDMAKELADADRFAHRENAKVLVLRGRGPAFSAAPNVAAPPMTRTRDLRRRSDQRARADAEALRSIGNAAMVKIAQVHGHCVGAGLVLASMCDRGSPAATPSSPSQLAFGTPFSIGRSVPGLTLSG